MEPAVGYSGILFCSVDSENPLAEGTIQFVQDKLMILDVSYKIIHSAYLPNHGSLSDESWKE